MSEQINLLYCPFCGGIPHIVFNAKRKNAYGQEIEGTAICCENCEATMFYRSRRLAIEAWNRRAPAKDEYEVRTDENEART